MTSINKITSLNNIQNTSFKGIEKKEVFSTAAAKQKQSQKSVVDPLYYQSINGINPPAINQKAIEQSRFFKNENYIPHTEKILDGFKDGGSFSEITDDGSVTNGNREVIVVDRTKDENLKDIIKDFKNEAKKVDTDEELLSDFTLKYVFENFVKNVNEKEKEYESGQEVLLGNILMNNKPVCRHVALLYKILADEIGLETDYIRGEFQFGEAKGRHAWVQVHEYGCTSIVDPSHNLVLADTGATFQAKDGSISTIKYDMPKGLKTELTDEDF